MGKAPFAQLAPHQVAKVILSGSRLGQVSMLQLP